MAIIRLQGESEKRRGIYYEVDSDIEPIGEGGTGKVYEGRCINKRTGETRPVAIKFLFAELPGQIIERARREASIQLRNDNLIEMLGFIETETNYNNKIQKHYHVVSELLHGVSLSDIFNGRCADSKGKEIEYAKKLLNIYTKDPNHFAKIVIKNVLSGLMALHDAGYIHRDIDPSNIMITEDNHIKLIDFGICKQMDKLTTHDKVQTVAGAFMGKPEYASPELALGDIKHQDQTTDIYAVGILLYQCILGHIPFDGPRQTILDLQVKTKIPTKNVIKNAGLRKIIDKACEKKQELRYQTSAEMRVAIESLDIKRAANPEKKKMMIGALIILFLVLGGGLTGLINKSIKEKKRIEQIENNTRDSLISVIKTSVTQANEYARKGYLHDEGYDKDLVNAKTLYDKADNALGQLKDKNIGLDYSVDKEQLIDTLKKAREELNEKVELLQYDNDPDVVAETQNIRERIKVIDKILNK